MADTTPLIESIRKLTWYVQKAHATFHGNNHPREVCIVCRNNDQVIAQLRDMGLEPHA